MANHRTKIFSIVGIIIGVVITHPYVMLVQYFTGSEFKTENIRGEAAANLFAAFTPDMLPMTISFAFFGGVCGLFLGLLFERNKRITHYQFQVRLHRDLTQSLQQLLSVVSHYILNSSLVISGQAKQLQKKAREEDLPSLTAIVSQVEKNEAILTLMKETDFLQNIDPADHTYQKLIELSRQVEKGLQEQDQQPHQY